MKFLTYILIILLSCSWFSSAFENHLCRDDLTFPEHADLPASSAQVALDAPMSSHSDESEAETEMCHFGHCSHGIDFSTPYAGDYRNGVRPKLFTPYSSFISNSIPRLALRPPALA